MNTHIVRVNEKIEKIENMIKESFGEEKVIVLSNNDNWILPPPTSTKSVPFWISLWNELGCNAMAL